MPNLEDKREALFSQQYETTNVRLGDLPVGYILEGDELNEMFPSVSNLLRVVTLGALKLVTPKEPTIQDIINASDDGQLGGEQVSFQEDSSSHDDSGIEAFSTVTPVTSDTVVPNSGSTTEGSPVDIVKTTTDTTGKKTTTVPA